MRTDDKLTGWERKYLRQSRGRTFIDLPAKSKVYERLLAHGLIENDRRVIFSASRGYRALYTKKQYAHALQARDDRQDIQLLEKPRMAEIIQL